VDPLLTAHSSKSMSGEEKRRVDHEQLQLMFEYACAADCRRSYLLNYFGEPPQTAAMNMNRVCCDNCRHRAVSSKASAVGNTGSSVQNMINVRLETCLLLMTVARCSFSYFGLGVCIKILRGSQEVSLQQKVPDYKTFPTYGKGKHKSEEWRKALTNLLSSKQYQFLNAAMMRGAGFSYEK
jgi:superfamily II DNA helicase RecQ